MLQQGGVPQVQCACRVTDGANGARVGLPGKQVAAMISYGLTAELLAEVLPSGGDINVDGIYGNRQGVADRMEAELGEEKWHFIDGCQREWDMLPPPRAPLIVGLDGGFIHSKDQKSRGEGWFEVIAGKSMPEEGAAKCFAYVQSYDTKPKRRLFELMKSQGLQAKSAGDLPVRRRGRRAGVAVVSEPGVRALARLVSRRDAAQGNGANGQRVGERAEHDISAGVPYRGGVRIRHTRHSEKNTTGDNVSLAPA